MSRSNSIYKNLLGMLTIALSLSSGIKLLERRLMVQVRTINRVAREAIYSMAPAVATADTQAAVADALQPLGIAKTVMPEQRMDFNHTFQHVRFELDVLYKKHNPIFTNTEVNEVWESAETASNQGTESVGRPLGQASASSAWHATTPALWISKTTLPDSRLDFNQTFSKVRNELDALYKKQNPNFTAPTNQPEAADAAVKLERVPALPIAKGEVMHEGRRLTFNDRAPIGNLQARKAMHM